MTNKELEKLVNDQNNLIIELQKRLVVAESKLVTLSLPIVKLLDIQEFELGRSTSAIKMSKEGLWVGKNKYSEAATATPAGTAIAINGDFYPKNGVSGTFVDASGTPKTITVTRGIITSIV